MKKITLFVCALATAVASFATTPKMTKMLEASKARQSRIESQRIEKEHAPLFKSIEAKEEEITTDTVFLPYAVPGAFHYGANSNGVFYYTAALYVSPFSKSLTFYNGADLQSTWLVNDAEFANDTAVVLPLEHGFGDYLGYTPVMQTPRMKVSETEEYFFPDYQYGALVLKELAESYPEEDFSDWTGICNAPCYLYPMTQCAIYTENESNYYEPFDYGTYGSSTGGDYWYGTKLVNNYISDDDHTYYMDTTAVFFSNPGVMYIDHVTLGIWTRGTAFNSEDDHIRLTLYPVNEENGFPDWENPIASATAFEKDLKTSNWTGIITFNFTEVDPISGAASEVPAIVEGDFYAVLDEYNDGTANFGFMSDDEMTTEPNTYFFFSHPEYGRIVYTQKYRTPANLLLSLSAFMPYVANAPKTVSFLPEDELTKVIELKTNTWAEDYEFDSEDWISVEAETVYDEETEDHTYVVRLTITLEESEEKREGTIEIDADAYVFSIRVIQNDDLSALDNVTLKNDGKTYNVLGVEVGEDYKGVVIRNGEKFVR